MVYGLYKRVIIPKIPIPLIIIIILYILIELIPERLSSTGT